MSRVVAIHQPNYLPWIGYFYKIAHCDVFVFLDNVQYEKRGFTNRNRIKTSQGPGWLTIAVLTRRCYYQAVKDVRIADGDFWHQRQAASLTHCYARSPYFAEYAQNFRDIYGRPWEYLADLNQVLVKDICRMLGIGSVEFRRASELNVSGAKSELMAQICREVGGDTYISPSVGGSRGYMELEPFEKRGVEVRYFDFVHPVYQQLWGDFCPNMSVVDLLFNEGGRSLDILNGCP